MKRLRLVHSLATIQCGLIIIAALFGVVRLAIAAIVVVLLIVLWSLETLRHRIAASSREIEK